MGPEVAIKLFTFCQRLDNDAPFIYSRFGPNKNTSGSSSFDSREPFAQIEEGKLVCVCACVRWGNLFRKNQAVVNVIIIYLRSKRLSNLYLNFILVLLDVSTCFVECCVFVSSLCLAEFPCFVGVVRSHVTAIAQRE